MGLSVLSRNQRQGSNIIFFVICAVAAVWSVLFEATFYIFLSEPTASSLHLLKVLNRASFVVGLFLIWVVLYFTYCFPKRRSLKVLGLFTLFALPIAVLSATRPIAGIVSIIGGKYQISSGKYVWVYILAIALSVVLIMYNLFSRQKLLTETQKSQNKLLATGFGLAILIALLLAVIAPIIFPNLTIDALSPIAILFFLLPVVLAIKSFKLFDLRIVIARSVAYIFSVGLLIGLYSTAVFGLAKFTFSVELSTIQVIFFALLSAITALVFQPIKRYFDKVSNRLFYRDAYDGQELLNNVNSDLVGEIDLYKLLNNTANTIKKNIKAGFCNFYIDQKASIEFHAVGTDLKIFAKSEWEELIKHLGQNQAKIISEVGENDEKIAKLLRELQIGAIVKMTSQDQDVGYLITGQKLSGNTYTGQDVQILEIIADEVAIAVQNNLRYEEIAHFNITLQKKVDDATAQLKKTNEKLVALDEAKDEFISMASHQLRTPLTSMKGYVSMVIDGDAGKISSQQKNLLAQAFVSSQRMVYLIADLLNVSRLKTGKFVIEAKPTYLPDVVESELSQLTETVKARGLEMVFDKPKEFPTLNLDETKTRQVIMNFADNAIYYTPKGGLIKVKLETTKDLVEFTVIDTGIGVPQADQHHLFTKFYRGGNARKARPDGTGLGLFMAKKVIAAEGGAIIFKTQEGKGSTFGFSFPRSKLEIKTDTSPQKQPETEQV
jgi:signal transduction histidine kinase/MFS family permease